MEKLIFKVDSELVCFKRSVELTDNECDFIAFAPEIAVFGFNRAECDI